MRLSTKNKVKHVPVEQLVGVFDGSGCGHIRWWRVGSVISSFVSLPSPSHQGLPIPYTLPQHGASHTPPLWYRIRANGMGLLEKPSPNESRNLRTNGADNLVKKECSEGSMGLNKVSGTKQGEEKGKGMSEYQSCLRKFSWRWFADLCINTFRGTILLGMQSLQRRTGRQWRRSLKCY